MLLYNWYEQDAGTQTENVKGLPNNTMNDAPTIGSGTVTTKALNLLKQPNTIINNPATRTTRLLPT